MGKSYQTIPNVRSLWLWSVEFNDVGRLEQKFLPNRSPRIFWGTYQLLLRPKMFYLHFCHICHIFFKFCDILSRYLIILYILRIIIKINMIKTNMKVTLSLIGVRHNTIKSRDIVKTVVYNSHPKSRILLELNAIDKYFIMRRNWYKSEFYYPLSRYSHKTSCIDISQY